MPTTTKKKMPINKNVALTLGPRSTIFNYSCEEKKIGDLQKSKHNFRVNQFFFFEKYVALNENANFLYFSLIK